MRGRIVFRNEVKKFVLIVYGDQDEQRIIAFFRDLKGPSNHRCMFRVDTPVTFDTPLTTRAMNVQLDCPFEVDEVEESTVTTHRIVAGRFLQRVVCGCWLFCSFKNLGSIPAGSTVLHRVVPFEDKFEAVDVQVQESYEYFHSTESEERPVD